MKAVTFTFLAAFVRERTGILIHPNKQYLLETRLRSVAHAWDLDSVDALADELLAHQNEELGAEIVDAMTTNETSFFRDQAPFQVLAGDVLPALIQARSDERSLRIWSAACSSGQEIYSVGMLLFNEFPEVTRWDLSLLATDISPSMTSRCEDGIYTRNEIARGMDADLIERHFFRVSDEEYHVDPALRRPLEVRVHNLLEPLEDAEPFDLIILRNVLIYFEPHVRTQVLEHMHSKLRPDGYLMLGAAEIPDVELFRRSDRTHASFYLPNKPAA